MSDVPDRASPVAARRGLGRGWAERRSTVVVTLAVSAVLLAGAAAVLITYWARGPLDAGHSWAWSHRWTGVTSGTAVVAVGAGVVMQVLTGAWDDGEVGTRRWWRARRELLEVVSAHGPAARGADPATRRAATRLARRVWAVLPGAGSAVGVCGAALSGVGDGFVRIDTVLVVALTGLCAVLATDAYRGARLLGRDPHARRVTDAGSR
jgi:hypothetical protein